MGRRLTCRTDANMGRETPWLLNLDGNKLYFASLAPDLSDDELFLLTDGDASWFRYRTQEIIYLWH